MILLNDIWDMNKYETCGMVLYFSVPLETKGMSCHWIILHISEVLYPISEEALRSKRALAGASDSAIHHFLSIFTPHSVLSLSQTADCHEFCTQPERFQDTSPWNLLSSRVRCSQINTSVWMPHYKVSEFYYEELGEEFNIHGKKKIRTFWGGLPVVHFTILLDVKSISDTQLLLAGLYSQCILLPLHLFWGEGKTGFGEPGVRIKQEGCAILREEGLFYHSLSPHQPRLPERILLTATFSEALSIICLYIFQQILPVTYFRRSHLKP